MPDNEQAQPLVVVASRRDAHRGDARRHGLDRQTHRVDVVTRPLAPVGVLDVHVDSADAAAAPRATERAGDPTGTAPPPPPFQRASLGREHSTTSGQRGHQRYQEGAAVNRRWPAHVQMTERRPRELVLGVLRPVMAQYGSR